MPVFSLAAERRLLQAMVAFLCTLAGSWLAFPMVLSSVASTPDGKPVLGRIVGNTGAPVCAGDRLTFTWLELLTVVVLPPDRSAFASARRGTRS